MILHGRCLGSLLWPAIKFIKARQTYPKVLLLPQWPRLQQVWRRARQQQEAVCRFYQGLSLLRKAVRMPAVSVAQLGLCIRVDTAMRYLQRGDMATRLAESLFRHRACQGEQFQLGWI